MTDDSTTHQEMFGRIVDLLQQYAPRGVPILTVAQGLGIDRKTAAKYLELLAQSGDVSMQRFGQKKLYRPSRRVPLHEVFDRLRDAILILDEDLQIRMVNASFLATLGIHPGRNLVGAPLFELDLPIFTEPAVRENIERIQQSQPYTAEMQLVRGRGGRTGSSWSSSTPSPRRPAGRTSWSASGTSPRSKRPRASSRTRRRRWRPSSTRSRAGSSSSPATGPS